MPKPYVLYKVTRPDQKPETIFYKSFKDGNFAQQLKAAKICLYEQIQKGVIKPGKSARTKLGLPGELLSQSKLDCVCGSKHHEQILCCTDPEGDAEGEEQAVVQDVQNDEAGKTVTL